MLDNTDIVKNVTPYFLLQMYVQIFCQTLLHYIYSKCGSDRLHPNFVPFVYFDLFYICDLYCVFMNVCFLAYSGISTFLYCNIYYKFTSSLSLLSRNFDLHSSMNAGA